MAAPAAREFVDAVDEQDRATGVVERGRVFDEGRNFRTVHVVLLDQWGRLLVQQLASGRPRHPGRWGSSVAGYLHAGESYEQAANRRVGEELGVQPQLRWVGRVAMEDDGVTKFVGVFSGEVKATDPLIQNSAHVEGLRWPDIDSLDRELSDNPECFTPTFRRVYAFWKESAGGEP